ncbi:ABC transporter substrate-binding protein [Gammaproteobacteria bacterium]|nr:ABC transporter substrate-binding protein [Gammaproteobacteria bacterium]
MFALHKNYFYIYILLLSSLPLISEEDPYIFIDSNAQKMVQVLIENKDLFSKDREAYEDKIKEIFDPMIDFRRVAASVMGKKYYQASSPKQRKDFVVIFRNSLLDTYAETLAQWGDQSINTLPGEGDWSGLKSIEVKQMLDTGSSKYPISYKLRKSDDQWMIVNIIVNGVNLGLTFRNQFQALANNHDGNIEVILMNWISDAGDAGIDG